MLKTLLFVATLCSSAACALADDARVQRLRNWHHWRGPLANGTAPQANPPAEWSEERNVKWKVEIPGKGSATPVIWQDRVFILTAIETDRKAEPLEETAAQAEPPADSQSPRPGRRGGRFRFGGGPPPTNYHQFAIICLDRSTGQQIWQQVAAEQVPHEGHHGTNTFASGSPTTDGQFVYAFFGSRGVYCFDMDGQLQWQRDLGDMQTRNGFGEGSSPTLHEDTLIVPWDHEGQSSIVALDAKTGQTRWQVDRDERTTWATPLVVEHAGRAQVITNGSNRVRSYDLATGELIWECGGQASNPIPSPVIHDGLVYCMTGYRGYAVYAIPIDASGDITDTEKVAWSRTDAGPYVSSPLLYGGQLYFTKSRNAILSCLDSKTGEPLIDQQRLPGLSSLYASPVAAADRIYFTGRDGTTLVIQHGSDLKVLATNQLDEGIDASPALVGKQLFLRGQQHLYCIEAG